MNPMICLLRSRSTAAIGTLVLLLATACPLSPKAPPPPDVLVDAWGDWILLDADHDAEVAPFAKKIRVTGSQIQSRVDDRIVRYERGQRVGNRLSVVFYATIPRIDGEEGVLLLDPTDNRLIIQFANSTFTYVRDSGE